ncbi:hypothetical protein ACF064_01645 [Streptomyces sp. NPDC015492]|uniref:hypothetical protein n=1 Tax=Streptomyces sp. NPDC015492 TaxID=3364958 RepID=UPI0036F88576
MTRRDTAMPTNHHHRIQISTADLIAALERLGGEATTAEVAAEANGGAPVGASLRSSVHNQLRDAPQVREGSAGQTGRRRSVWRLRAEATA